MREREGQEEKPSGVLELKSVLRGFLCPRCLKMDRVRARWDWWRCTNFPRDFQGQRPHGTLSYCWFLRIRRLT